MSSEVRVLRFAHVPDHPAAGPSGQVLVSRVLLDEHPDPVGSIVRQFQAWHYLLADGAPSGLVSTMSRADIEQLVAHHYFGPEPVRESTGPDLPLAM